MNGYAVTSGRFTTSDLAALGFAASEVALMPDDGRSCHDVVAAVAHALTLLGGAPVVRRGTYGSCEHSWIELRSGVVLDVYVPGRVPQVQLIDTGAVGLPEFSAFRWDE